MKHFISANFLQKIIVVLFSMFILSLPLLGRADDDIKNNKPSTYWLFPDTKNSSEAWLLNTKTGSLSKCTFTSTKSMPDCSPWTNANPDSNEQSYVYDVTSGKLIPHNEAARKKSTLELRKK